MQRGKQTLSWQGKITGTDTLSACRDQKMGIDFLQRESGTRRNLQRGKQTSSGWDSDPRTLIGSRRPSRLRLPMPRNANLAMTGKLRCSPKPLPMCPIPARHADVLSLWGQNSCGNSGHGMLLKLLLYDFALHMQAGSEGCKRWEKPGKMQPVQWILAMGKLAACKAQSCLEDLPGRFRMPAGREQDAKS